MLDNHENFQNRGDTLADNAISQIFGSWSELPESEKIILIQDIMKAIKQLKSNDDLNLTPQILSDNPKVAEPLHQFFNQAQVLPDWSDPKKIKLAENIFKEKGLHACVLFFCASLPEVYVIPDISTVLNITGQLEKATEQRIRSTATMILSVMLPNGITAKDGVGIVYTLKARIIHALIRFLILRNNPGPITEKINQGEQVVIPPIELSGPPQNLFEATTSAGWDCENGLPCNQQELAYTLLTFHYVFIRSLRRLGLSLSSTEEDAYFHTWNVVGHIMGIHSALLFSNFEEADKAFSIIRQKSKKLFLKSQLQLGEALMLPVERSIPFKKLKPLARLITEFLTSQETVQVLGIDKKISKFDRTLFKITLKSALNADQLAPKIKTHLSLVRFTIRLAGYQLLSKILSDKQHPLELPKHQIEQVENLLQHWSADPKAPRWLNSIEDRLTTSGTWKI